MNYQGNAAALLAQNAGRTTRRTRNPRHPFNLRFRPYEITPHFIAPVLPGETLKKAMIQGRYISAPLASDLIGWHAEQYYFYVKVTQLSLDGTENDQVADAWHEMFINPAADLADQVGSVAAVPTHYFAGHATDKRINWVGLSLNRVIQSYFRDENEGLSPQANGRPFARLINDNAFQSAMRRTDFDEADVDVDLNQDGTITASEVDKQMLLWAQLNTQGLTNKTFPDWLESHGVNVSKTNLDSSVHPELLRNFREWHYPGRIIDPATGAASSALSLEMKFSLDKDRFFKEPGFLFGITVFRPKMYLSQQISTASIMFDSAYEWLPGEALDKISQGRKEIAANAPLASSNTVPFVLDVRDLLLYGEQFIDRAVTEISNYVSGNLFDSQGPRWMYPLVADLDRCFLDAATDNTIRCDGVVSLNIASHLSGDISPAMRRGDPGLAE